MTEGFPDSFLLCRNRLATDEEKDLRIPRPQPFRVRSATAAQASRLCPNVTSKNYGEIISIAILVRRVGCDVGTLMQC